MSALGFWWLEDESPRDLARWGTAAALVLGVHTGIAAYVLMRPAPADIGGDLDAITVELAPIDSTPDAEARDVAPAPENMVESKSTPAEQQEKPRQKTKVEQPLDEAQAILPAPAPKPVETVEPAPAPAPVTAQKTKGGARQVEATRETALVRQIQRNKRYPAQAQSRNQEGVVLLGFSLDRDGHVLARRIAKSSGYPDLDDEVMAMILRAQPLPPFPPSMPQARLSLTVPIRFSLK